MPLCQRRWLTRTNQRRDLIQKVKQLRWLGKLALNMFVPANIRDFGKLFTVNHKHVCVCVWRTSKPPTGAVSAAANIPVNKYRCVHTHTALHVHAFV